MLARLKRLFLENRGTRQTVFKNMFWLSFGQIAGRLIRASVIIYAARALGAGDYGIFSYALGLAGFFTIFADVGINSILTREAAQKPDQRREYFATAFWIKLALLVFTALLIIFVAPFFSKMDAARALIPFIALLTIFDGIREFSNSYLRARERMEAEAFINTATNVAITAAGFAILAISANAGSLTLTYALAAGTGALIAVIVLRREYRGIVANARRALASPMIRDALPIAFMGLLGSFMLNVDMIMLGWWRTPEEIGFYSAAQKIVQVLYTLPSILASALFPLLARLIGKAEHDSARTIIERALSILFLAALPLTVGGIVLATPIITFLYGSEYLPAATAFAFLIATTLIVFPGGLSGNLVLAYNKQRNIVWGVALGGLSNVGLNILLIPPYGIAGAAVATIVAQLVVNGYTWFIVRREGKFRTFAHLGKIVVASLLMGASAFVLNLLGLHVLATIGVSAAIYVGALAFLRDRAILEFKKLVGALRG